MAKFARIRRLYFLKSNIFVTVAYMLHFTFFHAKIARENFIQRTHFDTSENQQILYKRAPHFIGDPFTNESLANQSLDC